MVKNFAPIIYFVAHGSSSANNPHHGAHDCGACSGRPGATNARVQSFILNHKKVRAILATKGIVIPDTCLLYTSDAADERSSVDLGGRRIIKNKQPYSNNTDRNQLPKKTQTQKAHDKR